MTGWQLYVNDLVGARLSGAAITGADGTVWAASPGFTISSSESQLLANFFTNATISGYNFTMNGIQFLRKQCDEKCLVGIKQNAGIIAYKTGTAIVIGYHTEGLQPNQAAAIVERVAGVIKDAGY